MNSSLHPKAALLERLMQAGTFGRPIGAQDTAELAKAVRHAMMNDCSIERGLGVPVRWRQQLRARRLRTAIVVLAVEARVSARTFATDLRRRLVIHRSLAAIARARRVRLRGAEFLYELVLELTRDRVPSVRTLRRLAADVGPEPPAGFGPRAGREAGHAAPPIARESDEKVPGH